METITLQYNPNSAFATALAALLHDDKDVSVMEKKMVTKRHRKTNYEKTLEACKDADEGLLNSYESVDDFFEKMGMPC
jgi:hypothetical protein